MKNATLRTLAALLAAATMTACVGCDNDDDEADEIVPTFANPIYSLVASNSGTRYGEADPWVYKHSDGYYYYTATYGGVSNGFDRIVIRRAKTINALDSNDEAESATIISTSNGVGTGNFTAIKKFLWAPELHYIDGTWYLFFTAVPSSANDTNDTWNNAPGEWGVKNYIAKCEDVNPLTGTWTLVGRMRAVIGDTFDETALESSADRLTMDITKFTAVGGDKKEWLMNLDGTAFKVGDQWYYAWAENIYADGWADEVSGDGQILTIGGVEYPDGANGKAWSVIVLGKVVAGSEFTQITNATVVTVPQYAWEWGEETYDENGDINSYEDTIKRNANNINVNEGPAVLQRNGKVFLVYSASMCDATYCLGMLTADQTADLCNIASWKKSEKPVFNTSVRNNVYGPGHCSFTTYKGYDVIVYHARSWPGLYSYYGRTNNYTEATEGLYDPYRTGRAKVFTWNSDGSPNFGEAE